MAQNLPTPKVVTKTVSKVEITSIEVDYVKNQTVINYVTLLEDDTPFKRGRLVENDTNMINPTSVYARVITHIGT